MSYITKLEAKKYLGTNWTSGLDTFVDLVIAGAQRYIERVCGDEYLGDRVFEAPTPDDDETRIFDGSGSKRLFVGDLFSLTSLTVDTTLLTKGDDFYLYPVNQDVAHYIEMAQPASRLAGNSRTLGESFYIFDAVQQNVSIVGKFYYSATPPDDIKLAMLKLVGAILKENIGDNDVKEVKQETLDDYSVTFQEVSKIAHALRVDDLLSPYVRSSAQGAKRSSKTGATSGGIIKI